ncbi:MarR family transcriptional regulator [Pseudomonas sp. F1_0610]|uniref:MarR family transcriptional regulator n=1 Tax=Pseudomonas sp. F1_0610 TaxID=3114284 RepID=UPI0039C3619F
MNTKELLVENVHQQFIKMLHAEEMNIQKQQEIFKKRLGDYSLTQIHMLIALKSSDQANNASLSQSLGLSKAAISKAISKLWDDNLIASYQQEHNKKTVFYRLTESGIELAEEAYALHLTIHKKYQAFLNQFDATELSTIENFLVKVTGFIESEYA